MLDFRYMCQGGWDRRLGIRAQVIADITRRMGAGMAEFIEREVEAIEDFDTYCHYVAGLVGIGLSKVLLNLLQSLQANALHIGAVHSTVSVTQGLRAVATQQRLALLQGHMRRGFRTRAASTAHAWLCMRSSLHPAG